ncbi:MAG: DUF4321 domain-containing protein [Synergistales bacterium]|nr:DUF4321 domain-containing protein [Synergistales bacterium]
MRTKRWLVIVVCIVLGTLAGLLLHRLGLLFPYFSPLPAVGFDLRELDLVFMRCGLSISFRVNLGTLIGAVVGIWLSR